MFQSPKLRRQYRKIELSGRTTQGCARSRHALCEQNIFSCLSVLMIMSHTTLAQGVSARHTIHVSCACVFDLSSTFSSHSSVVSPIFYLILLIFHFIFNVDRFGAKLFVRFRE